MGRRNFLLVAVMVSVVSLIAPRAYGLEPDKNGWYHTGEGVRTKSLAFITVKAYSIGHWVRALPPEKSKRAVIDLEADKRLAFRMLRNVGQDKIKTMFRDAFALNRYGDARKVEAFVAVFTAELKEGTLTTISYDAARKATTITTERGGTATIAGSDFMRATWSVWFGESEQPALGDALIAKL